MMKSGATHRSRLLAFVLTLMLVLTTWTLPAKALDDWENVFINVSWTDALGVVQTVPATPVEMEGKHVYWVTLDPAAVGSWLTVQVTHPDPEYRFYTMNGNDQLQWLPEDDAVSLDDQFAQYLGYDYQEMYQNEFILLYVSSQVLPEELTPEDQVQTSVQIPVYYMTQDSLVLDVQYVTGFPGETVEIWASSAATSGYTLVGSNYAQVTIDSAGNPSTPQVIFTYQPDQPAAPAEAVLPVYYYHVDGTLLDMHEVTLAEGKHTIYPTSDAVSAYQQIGDLSTTVTVYNDGSTDLASITFYYEEVFVAPAEAVIPVYYYHANGTLLDMQEITLTEGEHTVRPESNAVSSYNQIGDKTAAVTVYSDGSTNVANVVFYYEDVYVAPAEAVIPVYYYHENGTLLDMQEITLTEGEHGVKPQSSAVNGLELISEATVPVKVYSDGSADIANVTFLYKDVRQTPVTGEVTVIYRMNDGTMLEQQIITLPAGENTVYASSGKTAGLELDGSDSVSVYVDNGGAASPNPVIFTYREPAPTEAVITVYYHNEMGQDVAPAQTQTLPNGTHSITPTPVGLAENYVLAYGMPEKIEVRVTDGVPSQEYVVFYYELKQVEEVEPILPSQPVSVPITIRYYDTMGREIASPQTGNYAPGTHVITAAPSDLPDGYELAMDATLTLEVYPDGTYSPAEDELGFYYRPVQTAAKEASVQVYYVDSMGREVATAQTLSFKDGTHYITPEPADLREGYVLFEGMEEQVEILVNNGVANKNRVVFYYQEYVAPTATPVPEYDITIYYYDTLGNQIATPQHAKMKPGTYQITANPSDLPADYELAMEDTFTLEVYEDGSTNLPAADIGFWYRLIQPQDGTVTVTYQDQSGFTIAGPFQYTLAGNQTHTIYVDETLVPAGFDASSAEPVQVQVSLRGEVTPAQVALVFAENQIPVGEEVWRYARINKNSVAFRSEASTSGGNKTINRRYDRNSIVFVMEELYNERGERWAYIMINGSAGYMMSEYLTLMTAAENAQYEASLNGTPVPTFTPEPTESFVEIIRPESPTATPTAAPYEGYALTTGTTSLRTGASVNDMVIQRLEKETLVQIEDQVSGDYPNEVWSYVSTLSGQRGYVMDANLEYVSDQMATYYKLLWQQQNAAPEYGTPSTNTPEPMQVQGYAYAVGDHVPFREAAYEYSNIIGNFRQGTVVYISGQTYIDGVAWHRVAYDGDWGFVRSDLLRFMTEAEENAYLDSFFGAPSIPESDEELGSSDYDENGLSSYGYVSSNTVNFREKASTQSDRIRELKKYAMCLVLGSEYANNEKWYHVKYGETEGYIHGDYFQQMSITELAEFLNSDEYRQGLSSNTNSGSASNDDLGYTGTGGLVSAEDQTVNQWQDPNSGVNVSYAPFVPTVGTPEPITTELPSLEPIPGWQATNTPTPTASPTPSNAPLTDVVYPSTNDPSDSSALVWIVVLLMLLIAGGGAFAFVRYQQKRRRIAMRAAQRRAQAARSAERPYARQAGQSAQSRTGMYANQNAQRSSAYPAQQAARRPAANQGSQSYYAQPQRPAQQTYMDQTEQDAPPFEAGTPQSAYEKSSEAYGDYSQTTRATGRVGRRTAYRQAQAEQQPDQSDSASDDA